MSLNLKHIESILSICIIKRIKMIFKQKQKECFEYFFTWLHKNTYIWESNTIVDFDFILHEYTSCTAGMVKIIKITWTSGLFLAKKKKKNAEKKNLWPLPVSLSPLITPTFGFEINRTSGPAPWIIVVLSVMKIYIKSST